LFRVALWQLAVDRLATFVVRALRRA